MGLSIVFGRFVPNVSRIVAHLKEKFCKGEPEIFGYLTAYEREAFEKLK